MNNFRSSFYKNQSIIYKVVIFAMATALMIYFFPKKGKFKYEFTKGKPWQYENLYAPFDFAILKSDEALETEKNQIIANNIPFYYKDESIKKKALANLESSYSATLSDYGDANKRIEVYKFLSYLLIEIFDKGVLQSPDEINPSKIVYLNNGDEIIETNYGSFFSNDQISAYAKTKIKTSFPDIEDQLLYVIFDILKPNISLDTNLTEKSLNEELSKVLDTRGGITKDSRIIARGEIINEQNYQVLKSLQQKYEAQIWSSKNQNWIIVGYTVLVALAMMMLYLFLEKYRYDIFDNNTKVTFIVFNILLMVLITTFVVKYNPDYVYIVPICILPLVVKAFFDARLGLFTHVIAVLINGFIVPNSYEYMFLQIIVGIITILTVSELYKRANLFISVGQITLVYIIAFLAFSIIQEGTIINYEALQPIILFVLCGFATLIVHPLIYGFEKIFGLVSDVSLLELSDTNSKLLKELSNKAPGTFHHSLNVANIAEAAANEVGANSMLVRVGALYHDIGKMYDPTFFTENQKNGMNPHDQLTPHESAKVIINHTIKGIEFAKKNNLPDRVIDFIRTHHGTSSVYYFYMKAKEENPDVDIKDFQYPGPTPFSKETAILMMSDSVEAASKSLQNPTSTLIDTFVEKIINKQMDEGQFSNADITFKEIQTIKKVMKRKLNNMYHLRIEYPE